MDSEVRARSRADMNQTCCRTRTSSEVFRAGTLETRHSSPFTCVSPTAAVSQHTGFDRASKQLRATVDPVCSALSEKSSAARFSRLATALSGFIRKFTPVRCRVPGSNVVDQTRRHQRDNRDDTRVLLDVVSFKHHHAWLVLHFVRSCRATHTLRMHHSWKRLDGFRVLVFVHDCQYFAGTTCLYL